MSITRKAILIGAPSVKPELPGVNIDVNDIKYFLLSDKGGAWKSSEIITMIDPSPASVDYQISLASNTDYVFITCSGHGEHQVGKSLDETVMYLNERDTISINSINPKNKRHLIIVDVCRHLVKVEKYAALSAAMESATMDSARSQIDYRKVFDDAVMNTSEGRVVAYSCDINQAAGDDGNGGVFTQALLSSVHRFNPTGNNSYGIVNIKQAFDVAKDKTYSTNAPQTPVFNAGRRRDFFPFAIV
ncbi:caspase family protein [Methylobacter sp. Wu8]|uniref:caspase family protein n=1 Tax=Methylobacter sp. Wu8 TaxID=3118457 RepID=UPI002F2C692D